MPTGIDTLLVAVVLLNFFVLGSSRLVACRRPPIAVTSPATSYGTAQVY